MEHAEFALYTMVCICASWSYSLKLIRQSLAEGRLLSRAEVIVRLAATATSKLVCPHEIPKIVLMLLRLLQRIGPFTALSDETDRLKSDRCQIIITQ